MKPRGDVLGVGDGAGKEQELELGRRGEQSTLIVVAAGGIGEPVVFVDDEEVKGGEVVGARRVGGGDLAVDGLEGGDDERGGGVDGDVAGGVSIKGKDCTKSSISKTYNYTKKEKIKFR